MYVTLFGKDVLYLLAVKGCCTLYEMIFSFERGCNYNQNFESTKQSAAGYEYTLRGQVRTDGLPLFWRRPS